MAKSADGTETITQGLVPNRYAALAKVANHVAGLISAGQLAEMCGLEEHEVTEAEARRLWRAGEEVADRLYDIATRAESRATRR